jgi:hypothetical protein
VVEQLSSKEPGAQRRRSTRIVQSVPVTVSGVDALGQPFKERTSTETINCHGCRYQSKHYVLKDSWVTLEIPHPKPGEQPRRARAKIVWIQKPKTIRDLFQIAVELETPGNIWGIAFPPEDWFPITEARAPEIPVPGLPPAAPAVAPPPAPELRAVPPAGEAEVSASVARQVERMLAEARQQIQGMIRETAASTATAEASRVMHELSAQMQSAAQQAVEAAAHSAAQIAAHRAVERIEEARRAASAELQQEWAAVSEQGLQDATRQLAERAQEWATDVERRLQEATAQLNARVEETTRGLGDSFRAKLQEDLAAANARVEQLSAQAEDAAGRLRMGVGDADSRLAALRLDMQQALEAARAAAAERGREAEEAAARLQSKVAAAIAAAREEWRAKLESDMALAGTNWNTMLDDAVQRGTVRLAQQFDEVRREASDQHEQELQARSAEFGKSIEHAVAQAEQSFARLRETLAREQEQAAVGIAEIEKSVAHVREYEVEARGISQRAAEELERRAAEITAARSAELQQNAESARAAMMARLQPALEQTAQEFLGRLARLADEQLTPQLARATQVREQLAAEQRRLEQALVAHRERIQQVSEERMGAITAQLAESGAKLQREFAEAARVAMEKWTAELDAQGTETTHTTFEALLKASEWYQKKAQTAMQTVLEKLVDEAGGRLREQAGEVSGLFAAELDHRSRAFTEHARGMLEEAAKELSEQTLHRLNEYRDTRLAGFDDDAHGLAERTLAKLHDAGSLAIAEMSAQVDQRVAEARARAEAQAGLAVQEFERRLGARVEESVAAARQQMDTSLKAVLEVWEAERETQQQEIRARQAQEAGAAVEHVRERLELASNAWMAAAVTSLHAQAQKSITEMSRATEDHLHETFSLALAGLADSMRERLLRLAAELQAPKPEEPKP